MILYKVFVQQVAALGRRPLSVVWMGTAAIPWSLSCSRLGWLVGWVGGWLVGWLVGWLAAVWMGTAAIPWSLSSCRLGWLVGWLAGFCVEDSGETRIPFL